MHRRALFASVAVLFPAAGSAQDGAAAGRPLAYDVPSPPTATYHIADTMVIGVNSPGGNMEMTAVSTVALGLAFERDPGGVLVTGEVASFDVSMSNPMTGSVSAGKDDLEGSLAFVIGRRGEVEVTSLPALPGPAAQVSPFVFIAYEMFPRLPGRAVEPGETWVDTVTWSNDAGPMEVNGTAVYTYTLVGDTLVGGRALLNIAMSGEVETETSGSEGGMSVTQSQTGTTTGFVLWDTARGLPAYGLLERDFEGSTSISGMPSFPMSFAGPVRIQLEN